MSKDLHSAQIKNHSKKSTIVAVRLPRGLVDELKDIQKVNHFMDISDEIRFVVRKYCIKNMFNQEENIIQKTLLEQKKKEQLIQSLTGLLEELKKE